MTVKKIIKKKYPDPTITKKVQKGLDKWTAYVLGNEHFEGLMVGPLQTSNWSKKEVKKATKEEGDKRTVTLNWNGNSENDIQHLARRQLAQALASAFEKKYDAELIDIDTGRMGWDMTFRFN